MINIKFNELRGCVLNKIDASKDSVDFYTNDGREYRLCHSQSCCERVYLADTCGDLNSLIGSPILFAEEVSDDFDDSEFELDNCDSYTWTFYKISTINESVTLRWLGTSNGYYSEGVDFMRVK